MDLGHASTAHDQRAELVHQPILIAWIVVAKILLESFEELALPTLLAFQTEPYERRNRLADTRVDGLRVFLNLAGDRRREADSVSCCGLAPSVELGFPRRTREFCFMSSVCLKMHRFATEAAHVGTALLGTAKPPGSLEGVFSLYPLESRFEPARFWA
jgi:hypothetical protein